MINLFQPKLFFFYFIAVMITDCIRANICDLET